MLRGALPLFVLLQLLLFVVASGGCQTVEPCRGGTVFVDVTTGSAAAAADHLHVEVRAGEQTLRYDQVPFAGQSSYGLEVEFPRGYPAGQNVTLTITAAQGVTELQSGSTSTVLSASCARLALTLDKRPVQLTSIEPPVASGGSIVTLEGSFDASAVVHFPGGVDVPAIVLGPHRITATVPLEATAGDLTVTTAGQTLGPLPFRRASFALELGLFHAEYDQASGARPMPALATPRQAHASVLVGGSLYVVGGAQTGSDVLGSVERATVHADGALSSFTTFPGAHLVTARASHTAVAVGDALYVIGGQAAGGALASVERAGLAADGTLGPFAALPDVTLAVARAGHSSVIVGNSLYVLGGSDGTHALGSVERAILRQDGSLTPFATVDGVSLQAARAGHTTVVVGNTLYVVGGVDTASGAYLASVERATIGGDGSLSPFVTVAGVNLVTPRAAHTSVVLGDALYVVGGSSGAGLASVERAPLNADGSLRTFATVAELELVTPRSQHTSAVVGNFVYLLGGLHDATTLAGLERASLGANAAPSALVELPAASLVTARTGHTVAVVGNSLYVVGGSIGNNQSIGTVERATVHPDGSLSPFALVDGVNLTTPRTSHTSVVIGNSVYVMGGLGAGMLLASVERAAINADGSLSTFTTVPGVHLVNARYGHTSVVLGNTLFVVSGSNDRSVERATINADGSLSTFALVAGATLNSPRYSATSAVVANTFSVFGGYGVSNSMSTLEYASIQADGSLGAFITAGTTLLEPLYWHMSATVGDSLFIFGGSNSGTVERARLNPDGSLSSFSALAGVNLIRFSGPVTVVGNFLYVIGGDRNGALATVNQANLL